jgi:hypothetical protein
MGGVKALNAWKNESSGFRVRRKEHQTMNLLPEVPQVQRRVYPFLALQTVIFFGRQVPRPA